MTRKLVLTLLAIASASSILAAPPRTASTSKPQILREQEVGRPFKPLEKPADVFVSSQKTEETKGEGRLVEITAFLVSGIEGLPDDAYKGTLSMNPEDPDGVEMLRRLKPGITPGAFAKIRIREGGSSKKPFDFGYVCAKQKENGEYAAAFDEDGKFIKAENVKPITAAFGFSMNISSYKEEGGSALRILHSLKFAPPPAIKQSAGREFDFGMPELAGSTLEMNGWNYFDFKKPVLTFLGGVDNALWIIVIKEIPEN